MTYKTEGNNFKHGDVGTKFYQTWCGLKTRCGNKKFPAYANISYCDRWKEYKNFKEDMHESYLQHVKEFGVRNTTIDRIDNNGNYEPKNCRWATYKIQMNNRSIGVTLTLNGETGTVEYWAKKLGITEGSLRTRIRKGWSEERILATKVATKRLPPIEVQCFKCGKRVMKIQSALRRVNKVFCGQSCRSSNLMQARWDSKKSHV